MKILATQSLKIPSKWNCRCNSGLSTSPRLHRLRSTHVSVLCSQQSNQYVLFNEFKFMNIFPDFVAKGGYGFFAPSRSVSSQLLFVLVYLCEFYFLTFLWITYFGYRNNLLLINLGHSLLSA